MGASDTREVRHNGMNITDEQLDEIRRTLTAAVRKICPPWLAADADDLVQEATIKIVRLLDRCEGNRELSSSYLWRTAYAAMIDEIRRRRRRREVAMSDELAAVTEDDRQPGADGRAKAGTIRKGVLDCLGRLVPPRRRAVVLHLLGHAVPDIAVLMRWKVKRAENLVYRGLADLRTCLARRGLEP